jgi:hypothetical protein
VFEEFAVVLPLVFASLPMIIPWAKSVEMISVEEDIVYNDGITGSHFAVGGIDQIIIPFQVSSFIADVLRLSMATFQVQRSLI